MASVTIHERHTARTLLRSSLTIAEYYRDVQHALVGAPTHRLVWWQVRLLCIVMAWTASRLASLMKEVS